jgi:hypothetical protein
MQIDERQPAALIWPQRAARRRSAVPALRQWVFQEGVVLFRRSSLKRGRPICFVFGAVRFLEGSILY